MTDSHLLKSELRFACGFYRLAQWRLGAAVILAVSFSLSIVSSAKATDARSTQAFRAQALQDIAEGRDNEAIESYKNAIKAAQSQYGKESTYLSELYFEMGNLARRKGQSEAAQAYYRNAVQYRPNDVSARLQLAELERNTKNIPGAFVDAQTAFAKNPGLSTSRKELMMCLQLSGRPAEAAKIAATLGRTSKNLPAIPKNISLPKTSTAEVTPAVVTIAEPSTTNSNNNGPVVTSASGISSALHWQRKKSDDDAAKHAKEAQAAEDAKHKLEEAKKEKIAQEQKEQQKEQQKKREEADKKSKQKQKKDDSKKVDSKKSSKPKPGGAPATTSPPVDTTTSLKTTATTIPKSDEKAKSDKSEEKAEKPASKTHASVSAVTEKSEKPAAEKHDSNSLSENEPAKPKNVPVEKPQASAPAAMPSMPVMVPIDGGGKKGGKPHLGKTGLVPPPPPTPLFFAPPPMAPQAPPPAPAPKKAKPKPAAKEEDAPAAKPAEDNSDPDFLINWGGTQKKHK